MNKSNFNKKINKKRIKTNTIQKIKKANEKNSIKELFPSLQALFEDFPLMTHMKFGYGLRRFHRMRFRAS